MSNTSHSIKGTYIDRSPGSNALIDIKDVVNSDSFSGTLRFGTLTTSFSGKWSDENIEPSAVASAWGSPEKTTFFSFCMSWKDTSKRLVKVAISVARQNADLETHLSEFHRG